MGNIFGQLGGILGGKYGHSEFGTQIGDLIDSKVNKKKKNKVIQVAPVTSPVGELAPPNPWLVAGMVAGGAALLVLVLKRK